MASWSEAQSHNTGKRQPREVTHELVVLRNPDEACHKNSASSVEGNYTQLKNIRGPTRNYQQAVLKQDESKCNDDDKEKEEETTRKEPKSGKEYGMKRERSQCTQEKQLLSIVIAISIAITVILLVGFAIALSVAVLALIRSHHVANEEQRLEEMSKHMAEQVSDLQTTFNSFNGEFGGRSEYPISGFSEADQRICIYPATSQPSNK